MVFCPLLKMAGNAQQVLHHVQVKAGQVFGIKMVVSGDMPQKISGIIRIGTTTNGIAGIQDGKTYPLITTHQLSRCRRNLMLQIRYHQKFKGADTLLFAGSRDDIDLLRSFFLEWNGDNVDLIKYLQAQEKIYLLSVTAMHLKRDAQKDSFAWHQDSGTWLITTTYQKRIVGLLDGLLESNNEGHQYLNNGGSVQIMVAKDEYSDPLYHGK